MRIQQLPQLLLLTALLGACGSGEEKSTDVKPLTPAQKQAKIERIKLHFTQPVIIGSSVYVMYPLLLHSTDEEYDDSSIGSTSSGRSNTYWNIAFYNIATGESHLLSTAKPLVIYSYSESKSGEGTYTAASSGFASYAKTGLYQVDKLLYYAVRTEDFNHDGVIDQKDPNSLFTSDKAGRDFKQISPPGYNVETWQTVIGTNKILLQGTPDTDNNKEFDERDVTAPLVYSIEPNSSAKAVFSGPFTSKAKQLLHSQWSPKP